MRAGKVTASTTSLMMRKMRQVGLCSKSNPSLGWMSGAGTLLALLASLMTAPLLVAVVLLEWHHIRAASGHVRILGTPPVVNEGRAEYPGQRWASVASARASLA